MGNKDLAGTAGEHVDQQWTAEVLATAVAVQAVLDELPHNELRMELAQLLHQYSATSAGSGHSVGLGPPGRGGSGHYPEVVVLADLEADARFE